MTRTIGFTMDEAVTASATGFEKELKLKVGNFQRVFVALLEDDTIDEPLLLAVVDQLRNVLANRPQLQQLLGGQPVAGSAPAALGGGSPAPSTGPTQDQLDDANDRANAAEAQNRTLLSDRRALEQIVLDLGMSVPADTNTAFATDTPRRVADKIAEKERDAAAAVNPADSVLKADMLAHVNAVEQAEGQLHTGMMTSSIDGRPALKQAIADAKAYAS